jgi:hypothetical protein
MRRRFLSGVLLLWAAILWLSFPATLSGEGQRGDVLTDQQTEDLRQADDEPVEKLKLYQGYIEERITEIHRLDTDPSAQGKEPEIHNLYQEFTSICDELEDNMDSFDHQHADLRKALKLIVEKGEKWPAVLNEPKPDSQYDFARKTALDAAQSVETDAKQMLDDETKYFAEKKKGQKEKKDGG